MLCFTNSKFFSLPYKFQQTSKFRFNLGAASEFSVHSGMDHDIPPREQAFRSSGGLPDAPFDEVSVRGVSKSLADRDAKAAMTQLIGTVEDL